MASKFSRLNTGSQGSCSGEMSYTWPRPAESCCVRSKPEVGSMNDDLLGGR